MARATIPAIKIAGCCVGLAAACALIVLVSDGSLTSRTALESTDSQKHSDFRTVWSDWLRRVNREVKAAVGISDGLSPEKKMALNGLLSGDLTKDLHSENAVVSVLNKKYAEEKKDAKKAQPKPAQVKKVTPKAKVAQAVPSHRAAAKPVMTKPVPKVAVQQKASPINLKLAAKIARDDSKVAAAEKQAHLAAKNLLHMEKGDSHVAHIVHRRRKAAAATAAVIPHNKVATAQNALVQKIQHALSMEMKRSRADEPQIHEMTQKEEESWGKELHKWGLSR